MHCKVLVDKLPVGRPSRRMTVAEWAGMPRRGPGRKMKTDAFAPVREYGRTLPDVEEGTMYGTPALKVRGKMFACMASHKSAEPNTLVVMIDFAARDAILEDDPDTYYLKEHYLNYPCVLVRLSRIHADALRDLVIGAYHFVSSKRARKPARGPDRGTARRSRLR